MEQVGAASRLVQSVNCRVISADPRGASVALSLMVHPPGRDINIATALTCIDGVKEFRAAPMYVEIGNSATHWKVGARPVCYMLSVCNTMNNVAGLQHALLLLSG